MHRVALIYISLQPETVKKNNLPDKVAKHKPIDIGLFSRLSHWNFILDRQTEMIFIASYLIYDHRESSYQTDSENANSQ